MVAILECHNEVGGDQRFAAAEALLACGQSIAQLYQGAKRDGLLQPYAQPEAVLCPASFALWGMSLPCGENHMRRHLVYLLLWHLYFQDHPDLLVEACEYDAFRSAPTARCWYPRETYPGFDEDRDITHLGVFSGRTGAPILSLSGTQRLECDPAAAIAYLVYCQQEGMEPPWPAYLRRIGQAYHTAKKGDGR